MCTTAVKDVMSLNEENKGSTFNAEHLAGEITSAKQEMKSAQEEIDKLCAVNKSNLGAQEIDKELLLDINKLKVLWKLKDELSICCKQERLSLDARVSLLMEWQEVKADIEMMKAHLEMSRKRWDMIQDSGKVADKDKANATRLHRGVDMQSKWEDASEEAKSALDSFIKKGTAILPHTCVLIQTVQEVLPEAAMTLRELAHHIFLINSKKETYICCYHKICQHLKEKHDGAHIKGVAYTKEYEGHPPAGIWSCGCDEEACLFEFFVWKTWKVASMNKKLSLVEAMCSKEYWSCQDWWGVGSMRESSCSLFMQEEFKSISESGTTQIHKMDSNSDNEEMARRKKLKTTDSAGGKGSHDLKTQSQQEWLHDELTSDDIIPNYK
ncbi:hypothetical protein BDQ12DRAFT_671913 [Crucibulum laeve]|uniref:Uncharacterized protein n=1 Tax=Crucibulum laeve TaxID=68775 RepID=A0A5C3LF59_9AGAR|nr:hypothetical protein BDQ12DRAFT_671913 [Crucibulum laeve]